MNDEGDSLSSDISADHVVQPDSSHSISATQVPFDDLDSSLSGPTAPSPSIDHASAGQLAAAFGTTVTELRGGESGTVKLNPTAEGAEGYSDTAAGSVDTSASTNEEGQEWLPESEHELKRVKVYELIGSRWVDQGTAFCFGQFQEDTNEALLIARSEANYQDVILSTAIRSNDVYQRQQDTLIVWTEPDGVDYALSFQDPEGCSEVWNFILEVQRHMNGGDEHASVASSSPLVGPEQASITTTTIMRSGHLPTPQLGIIAEIERAIKALSRTQPVKERVCEYIQHEDYIKSLIEVMNQAEDLDSLDNLHALCSIMQTILMLNDHSMYEHILEDDIFFGVVGMLEYDPEFPTHKANYREFLRLASHFHQPIAIRDEAIQKKIHHTYRLQFLKDVVLARALDDSTFNVLNSCIIFNQIDIITHVQQDPTFLTEVVRLYVDEDMLSGGGVRKKEDEKNTTGDGMDVDVKPNVEPKPNGVVENGQLSGPSFAPSEDPSGEAINLQREVVFLIQQLCVMGKNVQLPARMALFRALVDRGILFAVQWALSLPEKEESSKPMICAAGEILAALLDHDLNGVRGHVLKQVVAIDKEREARKKGADTAETVLALMCKMLAQSQDLAVQSQVGDALKVLMDIPQSDAETHTVVGIKLLARGKDDPGTEKFLDYFYKHCIKTLFRPLNDVSEFKNLTEPLLILSRERTNLYVYLCDLLCNFALQHSFRSHFFLLTSNASVRVASLLRAKDKHLRLAAFRFFRMCLKVNNRNLFNHLIKHDIFKPIIDLTIQESRRDNLLSSSCQEFFEHIRRENFKDLIKHCMTRHEEGIRKLAETPLGHSRFTSFIRRWEMNNEPLPPVEEKPEKPTDTRLRPGQGRHIEAEEEDYFNADDDEDDMFIPTISSQWTRGQAPVPPMNTLKRKRRSALGHIMKVFRPPNLRSLGNLVDYGDDDDPGDSNPSDDDLLSSLPPFTPSSQNKIPPKPTLAPSPSISTGPKLTHRQILSSAPPPPLRSSSSSSDDDEDNLLETLVRSKPPRSLSAGTPSKHPTRLSEKRRREEEDDGPFSRLSKAKKPDLGFEKDATAAGGGGRTGGSTKVGDDPPPKKIKLKFGATSLGLVSSSSASSAPPSEPTPTPSEAGAKDGDTG